MEKIEGLKVGLEIHQQAGRPQDTKLFCSCPAMLVEQQPDLVVHRTLRASAGETGTTDAAATAEAAKRKQYIYQAFHDATCLVELDEEPPHAVNEEVMKTAIMVAKACGSTILPRVQFMRKTIVDGSATAGFQRTGLFAIGGTIPEIDPRVRIQTICVEEDSAKIVTKTPGQDTYNLSRLGVPLIEIATEPDITTPQQAQEVAAQLGMILRSTKRVKRGLGTIRQDLNVSVPGGTRVEVKGAQDLRMIPTVIEYEAARQMKLLELQPRFAQLRAYEPIDVTGAFSESSVGFVKSALARGDRAIGVRLQSFAGVLGTELAPKYRVGSDLADVARNHGFGGLIHSDEDMKKYGVSAETLREAFGATQDDAFILLIGNEERVCSILEHLLVPRLQQFAGGVPSEVRKANPDGTTSFLRPMPGASRMYPETDVPVFVVRSEGIEAPKLLTEQVHDLKRETGLSEDLVKRSIAEDISLVDYKQQYPALSYAFLAGALLEWPADISTRKRKEINPLFFTSLFGPVANGTLAPASVKEIMEKEDVFAPLLPDQVKRLLGQYAPMEEELLRAIISAAIRDLPGARPSVIMGKVMQQARGKAEGKRIMQIIEEEQAKLL